jgi:hypothetical protein
VCSALKSSISFFMRTPSPPPRKSHQTTVSWAWAAAVQTPAVARTAALITL